jgi:hypothetical protein
MNVFGSGGGGFRDRVMIRGRGGRGGSGLQGRGGKSQGARGVQGHRNADAELNRELRARSAQREEEMVVTEQQNPNGGDVEMQEAVEGDGLTGGVAGAKCSHCTKRGHFAAACKAEIYCCDL